MSPEVEAAFLEQAQALYAGFRELYQHPVLRYPPVSRYAYKEEEVVRSNVCLSRSSTRRRGTGQAHAARQDTTTRRALRDLGARRPSRAFSRGGGGNENHSEGRTRG